MEYFSTIIVGGGMVAGYFAKEAAKRQSHVPGSLLILSEEPDLPYERPPLSKSILAGKKAPEKIVINKGDFYEKAGISIRLNTRVETLNPAEQSLQTNAGDIFRFGRCILATGGRLRKLGGAGDALEGVHYLRNLREALAIRESMEVAKRAVLVGSGFIAMEVASVFAEEGLQVTMIFPGDRVWKNFFTPEMSAFFEGYYKQRGIRLLAHSKVTGIQGAKRVERVTLDTGEAIEADLVVLGIGIEPSVELAHKAGIRTGNGILTNEYLQTSQPRIYAAGDVANYQDILFGKRRRAEHWDTAVSHAKFLAGALNGEDKPFSNVPYFFSDEFDLSFEFWGETDGAQEVVYRGAVPEGKFSAWWLRDGAVAGAFILNRPNEERDAALRWISGHTIIDPAVLRDEAAAISNL